MQEPMTLLPHTFLFYQQRTRGCNWFSSRRSRTDLRRIPVVHASSAVPQLSRTSHPSDHADHGMGDARQLAAFEMSLKGTLALNAHWVW